MDLSAKELSIISDTDFLLTKAQALVKIEALLAETRSALGGLVAGSDFPFPAGARLFNGKISRGENYRQLPYRVLDQPALFTDDDLFTFRTLFWWGHFFSATLHLQGLSLERHRPALIDRIERLAGQDIYVSVGSTPWEYHYEPENYQLLTVHHRTHIQRCDFLKLSRKISLYQWAELPTFATGFLKFLLEQLA